MRTSDWVFLVNPPLQIQHKAGLSQCRRRVDRPGSVGVQDGVQDVRRRVATKGGQRGHDVRAGGCC